MDDAVAECGPVFCPLACAPGREETLLAPELAPNRGERIGEGGPLLAVPGRGRDLEPGVAAEAGGEQGHGGEQAEQARRGDRKSTRLNSSHANISYAVFCLKKKK